MKPTSRAASAALSHDLATSLRGTGYVPLASSQDLDAADAYYTSTGAGGSGTLHAEDEELVLPKDDPDFIFSTLLNDQTYGLHHVAQYEYTLLWYERTVLRRMFELNKEPPIAKDSGDCSDVDESAACDKDAGQLVDDSDTSLPRETHRMAAIASGARDSEKKVQKTTELDSGAGDAEDQHLTEKLTRDAVADEYIKTILEVSASSQNGPQVSFDILGYDRRPATKVTRRHQKKERVVNPQPALPRTVDALSHSPLKRTNSSPPTLPLPSLSPPPPAQAETMSLDMIQTVRFYSPIFLSKLYPSAFHQKQQRWAFEMHEADKEHEADEEGQVSQTLGAALPMSQKQVEMEIHRLLAEMGSRYEAMKGHPLFAGKQLEARHLRPGVAFESASSVMDASRKITSFIKALSRRGEVVLSLSPTEAATGSALEPTRQADLDMYTPINLVKRQIIFYEEPMLAVSRLWWGLFPHHTILTLEKAGGNSDPNRKSSKMVARECIKKYDYIRVFLLIYTHLNHSGWLESIVNGDTYDSLAEDAAREQRVYAQQALSVVLKDWERDRQGEEMLPFVLLHKALFILADLWTPTVSLQASCSFLINLYKAITRAPSPTELAEARLGRDEQHFSGGSGQSNDPIARSPLKLRKLLPLPKPMQLLLQELFTPPAGRPRRRYLRSKSLTPSEALEAAYVLTHSIRNPLVPPMQPRDQLPDAPRGHYANVLPQLAMEHSRRKSTGPGWEFGQHALRFHRHINTITEGRSRFFDPSVASLKRSAARLRAAFEAQERRRRPHAVASAPDLSPSSLDNNDEFVDPYSAARLTRQGSAGATEELAQGLLNLDMSPEAGLYTATPTNPIKPLKTPSSPMPRHSSPRPRFTLPSYSRYVSLSAEGESKPRSPHKTEDLDTSKPDQSPQLPSVDEMTTEAEEKQQSQNESQEEGAEVSVPSSPDKEISSDLTEDSANKREAVPGAKAPEQTSRRPKGILGVASAQLKRAVPPRSAILPRIPATPDDGSRAVKFALHAQHTFDRLVQAYQNETGEPMLSDSSDTESDPDDDADDVHTHGSYSSSSKLAVVMNPPPSDALDQEIAGQSQPQATETPLQELDSDIDDNDDVSAGAQVGATADEPEANMQASDFNKISAPHETMSAEPHLTPVHTAQDPSEASRSASRLSLTYSVPGDGGLLSKPELHSTPRSGRRSFTFTKMRSLEPATPLSITTTSAHDDPLALIDKLVKEKALTDQKVRIEKRQHQHSEQPSDGSPDHHSVPDLGELPHDANLDNFVLPPPPLLSSISTESLNASGDRAEGVELSTDHAASSAAESRFYHAHEYVSAEAPANVDHINVFSPNSMPKLSDSAADGHFDPISPQSVEYVQHSGDHDQSLATNKAQDSYGIERPDEVDVATLSDEVDNDVWKDAELDESSDSPKLSSIFTEDAEPGSSTPGGTNIDRQDDVAMQHESSVEASEVGTKLETERTDITLDVESDPGNEAEPGPSAYQGPEIQAARELVDHQDECDQEVELDDPMHGNASPSIDVDFKELNMADSDPREPDLDAFGPEIEQDVERSQEADRHAETPARELKEVGRDEATFTQEVDADEVIETIQHEKEGDQVSQVNENLLDVSATQIDMEPEGIDRLMESHDTADAMVENDYVPQVLVNDSVVVTEAPNEAIAAAHTPITLTQTTQGVQSTSETSNARRRFSIGSMLLTKEQVIDELTRFLPQAPLPGSAAPPNTPLAQSETDAPLAQSGSDAPLAQSETDAPLATSLKSERKVDPLKPERRLGELLKQKLETLGWTVDLNRIVRTLQQELSRARPGTKTYFALADKVERLRRALDLPATQEAYETPTEYLAMLIEAMPSREFRTQTDNRNSSQRECVVQPTSVLQPVQSAVRRPNTYRIWQAFKSTAPSIPQPVSIPVPQHHLTDFVVSSSNKDPRYGAGSSKSGSPRHERSPLVVPLQPTPPSVLRSSTPSAKELRLAPKQTVELPQLSLSREQANEISATPRTPVPMQLPILANPHCRSTKPSAASTPPRRQQPIMSTRHGTLVREAERTMKVLADL